MKEFPLTPAQQSIWVAQLVDPGSTAYQLPLVLRLRGSLDAGALGRAWTAVQQAHEALRTRFVVRDGTPAQAVQDAVLSLEPSSVGDVRGVCQTVLGEPFDLTAGPPVRAVLDRLGQDDHLLVVGLHHLVADGWSLRVLTEDLAARYQAELRMDGAGGNATGATDLQLADVAVWQDRLLRGDRLERLAGHWEPVLAGVTPSGLPAPKGRGTAASTVHRAVPADVAAALARVAAGHGVSRYTLLAAALAAVLRRYGGQEQVPLALPLAGRDHPGLQRVVGCLVTTMPLLVDTSGDPDLATVLHRVASAVAEATENAGPTVELLETTRSGRPRGFPDVVLAMDESIARLAQWHGLTVDDVVLDAERAKFVVSLFVRWDEEGLALRWESDDARVDSASVARAAEHLEAVLAHVAAAPNPRFRDLPAIGPADERVVTGVAAHHPERPGVRAASRQSLADRFDTVATFYADRTAITVSDGAGHSRDISYRELYERVQRLARHLLGRGAGPDAPVAVCLPRSPDLLVVHLAAAVAGAPSVPLDPAHPDARLHQAVVSSGAVLVVTSPADADRFTADAVPVVDLHADAHEWAWLPPQRPHVVTRPADVATIVFTSGSTGEPKPIALTHGAISTLVLGSRDIVLDDTQVLLHVASPSFDASVWEVWSTVLTGARAVLMPSGPVDPRVLSHVVHDHGVTLLLLTTTLFNLVVDADPMALRGVAQVVVGGEAASPRHIDVALRSCPGTAIVNAYGPAECTVISTTHACAPAATNGPLGETRREIPIGTAVPGATVEVVDADLRPVPVGVIGELVIGGAGVARYWRDPALTASRFVPDAGGGRRYRTGDLVRWDDDGLLVFVGRSDDQVKIRGHRVHLRQVEVVLAAEQSVGQVAVRAVSGRDGLVMVAWVAPVAGLQVDVAAVRRLAAARLPQAVRPAHVVVVDRLPVTASGKVDTAALPLPSAGTDGGRRAVAAPRTPTERAVVAAVSEVLERDTAAVSVEDAFFDIGGHSLSAVRLVSTLSRTLGHQVPLAAVFEHPVMRDLATHLDLAVSGSPPRRVGGGSDTPVTAQPATDGPLDDVALTPAQRRLHALHRLGDDHAYHVVAAFCTSGRLDQAALVSALDDLVVLHPALRWSVHGGETGTVARYAHSATVPVLRLDGRGAQGHPVPEDQVDDVVRELLASQADQPFDWAQPPLCRAVVVDLGAERHAIALVLHHVIADGWSVRLLARDWAAGYRRLRTGGARRPDQVTPTAVASGRETQEADDDVAWWRAQLDGVPHHLALPHDRRPVPGRGPAGTVRTVLDRVTARRLREFATCHGTTEFTVLATALGIVLGRGGGRRDVVVGVPFAGREDPAVAEQVAFLVNTVPLRVRWEADQTVREVVGSVHRRAVESWKRAGTPFDEIVRAVGVGRDPARPPLVQAMLAWQPDPYSAPDLDGLAVRPLRVAVRHSKLELLLDLGRTADDTVEGDLEYDTRLFDAGTAELLARRFTATVRQIVGNAGAVMRDVTALDEVERTQQVASATGPEPRYDGHRTVTDLVLEQAARTPDATAVSVAGYEDAQPSPALTYRELVHAAQEMAADLRARGAGAGRTVAVELARGPSLVVALLAVMLTGADAMPLDPGGPAPRREAAFRHTGATIALRPDPLRLNGISVDVLSRTPSPGRARTADEAPRPEDVAFTICTSGSTGEPKAVQVSHAGLAANVLWMQQDWPLAPGERVLFKTPPIFDVAFKEVFWALATGCELVVAPPGAERDPEYLARTVSVARIDVLHLVPSMLASVLDVWDASTATGGPPPAHLPRILMSGAEVLPGRTARRLLATAPRCRLLHLYGPTETAIAVTGLELDGTSLATDGDADATGGRLPLGRPMPGVRVHLVDDDLREVPPGTAGEIVVAGPAVGRGYSGDPGQTALRFVPDPFGVTPGGRMYLTGDLGRVRPDGLLEFLGRRDNQVKVRGQRIELEEIETVLARHPAVRAVVAGLDPQRSVASLVAAVAVAEPVTEAELKEHLAGHLPDYMVPDRIVVTDRLPAGSTGKVDRRAAVALAAEAPPAQVGGHQPVVTGTQALVARVWEQVMGRRGIAADDDFFALGGHSLLVAAVIDAMADRHGRRVPLRTLFEHPVLSDFASAVDRLAPVTVGSAGDVVGSALEAPVVPQLPPLRPRRRPQQEARP